MIQTATQRSPQPPPTLASAANRPPPPDKSGHPDRRRAMAAGTRPVGHTERAATPGQRPATARAPKAPGVRRR
jgi:hypothetical protein